MATVGRRRLIEPLRWTDFFTDVHGLQRKYSDLGLICLICLTIHRLDIEMDDMTVPQ